MENNEKKITIDFSVDELNKIIHGLAQMPYNQVYETIEKIKINAHIQLSGPKSPGVFKEEANTDPQPN